MRHVGNVIEEKICTGCGACTAVCPQFCVELKLNCDGYWKRSVKEERCIECQKCLAVCSAKCDLHTLRVDHSYVVYAKNREISYKSASGGFAYLLSKYGIKKGYTIVGTVWDLAERGVKHTCIKDLDSLELLRKSKYVQSYTPEVFQKISKEEKFVIIGTPCQIQGFYNIYGNRDNMLLVELDCMGPAGKNLLDKYVKYLNTVNSSGIKNIVMRDKTKDWLTYGTRVIFEDGTEYYADKYKDPFCQCFNFAHTIQDTCLEYCRWTQKSAADIRIGDAWDYAGQFPYKIARNGLSLVSVQTSKGMQWFHDIQAQMEVTPISREMPQRIKITSDQRIFQSLRDENQTILDAVKLYCSQTIRRRFIFKIEEVLSRNFYVYIFAKKMKSLIRR